MHNRNLRLVNVALGVWLLISSFMWRPGSANFINMFVTALVIIVTALLAIRTPRFRFVSAAAGVWVIASLFAWPDYSSPIVWNNLLVGAGVALVSMVGPQEAERMSS
jgi:hypothetical protein